jgi:serine/threonine protein kinase
MIFANFIDPLLLSKMRHASVYPKPNYTKLKEIGQGLSGKVFKAEFQGAFYAVKVISKVTRKEITQLQRFEQSIRIVSLQHVWEDESNYHLGMELAEGDMQGRMDLQLDESQIARFGFQVLQGLACLQKSDIVFCDLKGSNILRFDNGTQLKVWIIVQIVN